MRYCCLIHFCVADSAVAQLAAADGRVCQLDAVDGSARKVIAIDRAAGVLDGIAQLGLGVAVADRVVGVAHHTHLDVDSRASVDDRHGIIEVQRVGVCEVRVLFGQFEAHKGRIEPQIRRVRPRVEILLRFLLEQFERFAAREVISLHDIILDYSRADGGILADVRAFHSLAIERLAVFVAAHRDDAGDNVARVRFQLRGLEIFAVADLDAPVAFLVRHEIEVEIVAHDLRAGLRCNADLRLQQALQQVFAAVIGSDLAAHAAHDIDAGAVVCELLDGVDNECSRFVLEVEFARHGRAGEVVGDMPRTRFDESAVRIADNRIDAE